MVPRRLARTRDRLVAVAARGRGQGLAAEAAGAARAHAFGALGWTTAVSYVDPGNARSIALAERMGAIRDDAAPVPHSDRPCLVYRHSAAHAKGAA